MAKRFDLARKYTEKYKKVLLPCKYCGNTDIYITSDRTMRLCSSQPKPKNVWSVMCGTEHCDFVTKDRAADAVAAWNERMKK